jgi:hypothetical protein
MAMAVNMALMALNKVKFTVDFVVPRIPGLPSLISKTAVSAYVFF